MKKALYLIAFSLLFIQYTYAQWQAVNIPGLSNGTAISKLYYDGSVFWAGGTGQIFKSTDGGNNWTQVSNGLQSGISSVSGIVKQGNRVYASFIGNGNYFVYYTTDGGANWVIDTAGWNSIAGVVPATVQLTTHKDYVLARCESNFIMYKKNTDTKWTALSVLPAFRTPGAVYSIGDSLFLGMGYISGSTDMGATWPTVRTTVWPAGLPMGFINGWFQDQLNPATIYGNYQVLSTSKPILFVTKNNQITWDSIHMNISQPALVSGMYVNGNDVYAAYTGSFTAGDTTQKCFHSTDGGKTWTNITGNLYSFTNFKFHSIRSLQVVNGYCYAAGFSATGLLRIPATGTGFREQTEQPQFSIYPNPAHSSLRCSQKPDAYTITDVSGKVLQSGNDLQSDVIPLESISPGIYFITVWINDSVITKRIIKE